MINRYIKEITCCDFTAKDFRAWAGSLNALCAFQEIGEYTSITDCKRKVVDVLDSVAKKLGNTRTVCRKYYVHPTVIASYEKGSIWNYKPRKTMNTGFNAEEKALLKLLTTEDIAEVVA